MAVKKVRVKSDSTGAATASASSVKPTKASSVKPTKASSVKPTKASSVKPTKASSVKPTKERSGLMPIRVHYNVGPGNRISVRGDTDPFRWDCGIDARNMASDVWEFQLKRIPAGQTFQFKPLINDTTYSTGENYVVTGGKTLDIYPAF